MIYESAGSEVLTQLIDGIRLQVGPFLVLSMELPEAAWTTERHQTLSCASGTQRDRGRKGPLSTQAKVSGQQTTDFIAAILTRAARQ
jgi:hypothetical protein